MCQTVFRCPYCPLPSYFVRVVATRGRWSDIEHECLGRHVAYSCIATPLAQHYEALEAERHRDILTVGAA